MRDNASIAPSILAGKYKSCECRCSCSCKSICIRSKKYNQEIHFPFKYRAERLYKKNKTYDLFINIKYNQSPIVKGKGSAIFLHLTDDKYKATRGCIAILKKDFLKILPLINRNTKISIN